MTFRCPPAPSAEGTAPFLILGIHSDSSYLNRIIFWPYAFTFTTFSVLPSSDDSRAQEKYFSSF
ncbi:unnamed protein product [Amoebophrya sp. A120]|nr:unnamed protein product [Amoebophrya sp. A120]|eukprot:GSA120T00012496001.1